MSNIEKYKNVFVKTLSIDDAKVNDKLAAEATFTAMIVNNE